MKFCIAPVQITASTGYGTQSRHIANQLLEMNHKVYNLGGEYLPTYGIENYLKIEKGDVYWLQISGSPHGGDVIDQYQKIYGFDMVITLMDIFGLPYLSEWKTNAIKTHLLPIDSESFSRSTYWQELCSGLDYIVAFSKFGFDQLMKSDIPNHKCRYIPHILDCNVLKPSYDKLANKDTVLKKLHPFDEENFKFLHVGANVESERKRHYELMWTFKRFVEEVDKNAVLIMYCDPSVLFPHGGDYSNFVQEISMENNIIFPKMPPRLNPLSKEEMAILYNLSDVYCSCSEAEAFGIPLVESCSSGTPIICPKNSAQKEHVIGSGGFPVDVIENFPNFVKYTPFAQANYPPSLDSLFDQMYKAYNTDLKQKSKKARNYALNYDYSKVGKKWRKFVNEVNTDMDRSASQG